MQGEIIDNYSTYDFNSQTNQQENYYNPVLPSANIYNTKVSLNQDANFRRNLDDEEEKFPTEKSTNVSAQSLLSNFIDSMAELEKSNRNLEMENNLLKLRKEMLSSILEQKRKQADSIKLETKKYKVSSDKFRDNINVMSREIEFLNDMILVSSSSSE